MGRSIPRGFEGSGEGRRRMIAEGLDEADEIKEEEKLTYGSGSEFVDTSYLENEFGGYLREDRSVFDKINIVKWFQKEMHKIAQDERAKEAIAYAFPDFRIVPEDADDQVDGRQNLSNFLLLLQETDVEPSEKLTEIKSGADDLNNLFYNPEIIIFHNLIEDFGLDEFLEKGKQIIEDLDPLPTKVSAMKKALELEPIDPATIRKICGRFIEKFFVEIEKPYNNAEAYLEKAVQLAEAAGVTDIFDGDTKKRLNILVGTIFDGIISKFSLSKEKDTYEFLNIDFRKIEFISLILKLTGEAPRIEVENPELIYDLFDKIINQYGYSSYSADEKKMMITALEQCTGITLDKEQEKQVESSGYYQTVFKEIAEILHGREPDRELDGGRDRLSKRIKEIEVITGQKIRPSSVKFLYDLCLGSSQRNYYWNQTISLVESITGVPPTYSESAKKLFFSGILEKSSFDYDYFHDINIEFIIKKINSAEEKLNLKKVFDEAIVQCYYHKLMGLFAEGELSLKGDTKINQLLETLGVVTGVPVLFSEHEAQVVYGKMINGRQASFIYKLQDVELCVGFKPDFIFFGSRIQEIYSKLLDSHVPVQELASCIDTLKSVVEVTGVKPVFESKIVQEKYLALLQDKDNLYGGEAFKYISEFTGITPDWQDHRMAVQEIYASIIESGVNILDKVKRINSITGLEPVIGEVRTGKEIQKSYAEVLLNRKIEEIPAIKSITGVVPEWTDDQIEFVHDLFLDALKATVTPEVKIGKIQECTGVKPVFDRPTDRAAIQDIYNSLIKNFNFSKILAVTDISRVGPDWEKHRQTVLSGYDKMLKSICEITRNINQQQIYSVISELQRMSELSGIAIQVSEEELLVIHVNCSIHGSLSSVAQYEKIIKQKPEWQWATVKIFYDRLLEKFPAKVGVQVFVEYLEKTRVVTGFSPEYTDKQIQDIFYNMLNNNYFKFIQRFQTCIGVPPVWQEERVQPIYAKIFATVEFSDLIKIDAIREITSIKPVVEKNSAQRIFTNLLSEFSSGGDFGIFMKKLDKVKETLGSQPDYTDEQVQNVFHILLSRNSSDTEIGLIPKFQAYIGVPPIWQKEKVRAIYNQILKNADLTLDFIVKISRIQEKTNIKPEFDAGDVQAMYAHFIKNYDNKNTIILLGKFMDSYDTIKPDADKISKLVIKFLHDSSADRGELSAFIAKYGLTLDWEVSIRQYFSSALVGGRIREAVLKVSSWSEKFGSSADLPDLSIALENIKSSDHWLRATVVLRSVQAINEKKEENDPWHKDLGPLVKKLFEDGTISLDEPKDAEILTNYVKQFGMLNLPKLFSVTAECLRCGTFENMKPEVVQSLEQFGIKLRRSDGTWRFQKPEVVLNELKKAVKAFQYDLLADKVTGAMTTELGLEIINSIKGNTMWSRGDINTSLVQTWKVTVESSPELVILPEAYKESKFEVPIVKVKTLDQNKLTAEEIQQEIEIFLGTKEVADVFAPVASSLRSALAISDPSVWWAEYRDKALQAIQADIISMDELLKIQLGQLDERITNEQNVEERKKLEKKRKALGNPKGREGMEKQLTTLMAWVDKIRAVDFLKYPDATQFIENIPAFLEQIIFLQADKAPIELSGALRTLSAWHIMQIQPGWNGTFQEHFTDGKITEASVASVDDFTRDYLSEHYLNEVQNPDHVGHAPFSEALRRELVSLWQMNRDKKNKFVVTRIKDKIDRIKGVLAEETDEVTKVSMVPAAGLLRIFAGDIGDACYTSKHSELASGKFPGLKAWIYVTNRGESNETLQGSLLGISTHADDGTPVLLARANNPRQNFIQSVNAEEFIAASLQEVVETAKRMREARVKTAKDDSPKMVFRQCVVVPFDSSGKSSTNRPAVAGVYHKWFNDAPKIGLKNEPETNFNGYPVWNKDEGNACVKIWEIDETGKETWYVDL